MSLPLCSISTSSPLTLRLDLTFGIDNLLIMQIENERRGFLKIGLFYFISSLFTPFGARADQACLGTPQQEVGPFYPKIKREQNTDLVEVKGKNAKAKGEIIYVEGIVMNIACRPLAGVVVEIWQACSSGRYDHELDTNPADIDPNFQYFGRAITDNKGYYRFRTIIPGSYPVDKDWARPPHIHFKVQKRGYQELITQMYFEGQSLNEKDKILLKTFEGERSKVIVKFEKRDGLENPVGTFNISLYAV